MSRSWVAERARVVIGTLCAGWFVSYYSVQNVPIWTLVNTTDGEPNSL